MSNKSNKINMADTYQTRDGRKVRVRCIDRKGVDCPVVALVEEEGGSEAVLVFYPDGKYFADRESQDDLIPAPKFSAGDIWLCRDGETKAEILKTDLKGEYPIAGVMTYSNGVQTVNAWTKDGLYCENEGSPLDLITKL